MAAKIARKALSAKPAFGGSLDVDRSTILACLIEAGAPDVAHALVKTCEAVASAAVAFESVGLAMTKTDRGQLLLSSEWRNGIGAFQRAHLYIGAAKGTKENAPLN